MIDEELDRLAKDYAEKRKKSADLYYKLVWSSAFALVLLVTDFISEYIYFNTKFFFLILLFPFTFLLYKKWSFLTKTQIIAVRTPDGIYVNSVDLKTGKGGVRIRVGGDTLIDKIRNFFEEI